ncbi:hypothetical protein ABGB09_23120 [Streptomyces sp. B8F3]|uniref:hypothetical protein n=1 Tax=Streptomyces sp. B8F3 TaxID=3153573 RepID=UPI00325ED339
MSRASVRRRPGAAPTLGVHVNTLLLQHVLAEPKWAKKLSDEARRGLTALFGSNADPYVTFRLDKGKPARSGGGRAPTAHLGDAAAGRAMRLTAS